MEDQITCSSICLGVYFGLDFNDLFQPVIGNSDLSTYGIVYLGGEILTLGLKIKKSLMLSLHMGTICLNFNTVESCFFDQLLNTKL